MSPDAGRRPAARAGPGPWPSDADALRAVQTDLAEADPPSWEPGPAPVVGGSYCCAARGPTEPPAEAAAAACEEAGPRQAPDGDRGERGWAGAARKVPGAQAAVTVAEGLLAHPYEPGLLALREGPLRETALRRLGALPDVVLVDATGGDHPRRAGLAAHLGAVLDVPTIGVTARPLLADGEPPDGSRRGARSPLSLGGDLVGFWLRTRTGVRPLAVHAAWRTDPETAARVVLAAAARGRTPQPLREARRAARAARGTAGG